MSSAVFLEVKILQSIPQASARPAARDSDITETSVCATTKTGVTGILMSVA